MTKQPDTKLVRATVVARFLGVSARTARKWIRIGIVPGHVQMGRDVYVSRAVWERWRDRYVMGAEVHPTETRNEKKRAS